MHEPIAYTYDAAEHCPACTLDRFGRDEHGDIAGDAVDSEGNPVGVIAPWDEIEPARGIYCDTCGAEIVEALPYVVVENTPGYLPESDDPGCFATLDEARSYAGDLVSEIVDRIDEANYEDAYDRVFNSPVFASFTDEARETIAANAPSRARVVGSFDDEGTTAVYVYDDARSHDLGRVVEILDTREN